MTRKRHLLIVLFVVVLALCAADVAVNVVALGVLP